MPKGPWRDWPNRDPLRPLRDSYQARRRERLRQLLRGDSVTTLMLGTASAALALVVFAVTLMSLVGIRTQWHEVGIAGNIYRISRYTLGLGYLGIAFGVLGLVLAWRRRQLSWTSAFGLALTLVALWAAVIYEATKIPL
jgi:hypothetical protein